MMDVKEYRRINGFERKENVETKVSETTPIDEVKAAKSKYILVPLTSDFATGANSFTAFEKKSSAIADATKSGAGYSVASRLNDGDLFLVIQVKDTGEVIANKYRMRKSYEQVT
jgi:hypothetical protein